MIQEKLYLDTPDGKKVLCAVDRANVTSSDKAVVLAHGLTGHPFEYIHMMARNYFIERGYDVYRPAFYWWEGGTRVLDECTVQTHAQDLSQVIDMAQNTHKKVYCAGHSYGGLTLLHSNPDISAISFWDASYIPSWFEGEVSPLKDSPYYILSGHTRNLVSEAMVEEAKQLTSTACKELSEKISSPSQVVVCSLADNIEVGNLLYQDLKSKKQYIEIKGADHCFYNGDTVHDLLKETHAWFKEF